MIRCLLDTHADSLLTLLDVRSETHARFTMGGAEIDFHEDTRSMLRTLNLPGTSEPGPATDVNPHRLPTSFPSHEPRERSEPFFT